MSVSDLHFTNWNLKRTRVASHQMGTWSTLQLGAQWNIVNNLSYKNLSSVVFIILVDEYQSIVKFPIKIPGRKLITINIAVLDSEGLRDKFIL